MKKFNYDSLLKIKRPVMLVVKSISTGNFRYRILFPDGTCIWNTKELLLVAEDLDYTYSCFIRKNNKNSLSKTLIEMKKYDNNFLKVVKVIKL